MTTRRHSGYRALTAAALVIGLSTLQAAPADNWPQFRGLTGGVIPDNSTLPDSWSQTENVAWKVPLPGQGWGSPIVWGDFVFVTAAVGDAPDPNLTSIVP